MDTTRDYAENLKLTGEPLLVDVVGEMSHEEVLLGRIVETVRFRVLWLLGSSCSFALSFAFVSLRNRFLFFLALIRVIRIIFRIIF